MDALQAIGDPGLREALLFVRSRPQDVTIRQLAEEQGTHYNVARRRLERLVAAGLLTSRFRRTTGRSGPGAGRPAKVYSPAPENAAIEFPQRRYAELVGLLVDRVSGRRLAEVGMEYGTALAADGAIEPIAERRAGLERLCAALGSLGFQATVGEVSDERAEIVTPVCPLRPLVVANPAAAEIDHGLWRGLVASALEGVDVDDVACETHDCLEPCASCRIVLSLSDRSRD